MRRVEKKRKNKKIARERIDLLFALADEMAKRGDVDLSTRYVELIFKISRKYNVRLGREKKMRMCKNCHSFLIPGKNAQVRLKKGRVVIKCKVCGTYKRYPINP